jgi:hypothetical protein
MFKIGSASLALGTTALLYHYTRNINRQTHCPKLSHLLPTPNKNGLLTRNLSKRAMQRVDGELSLKTFVQTLFSTRVYSLELLASGYTEPNIPHPIKAGNKFGNLVVSSADRTTAIMDYQYPGFDFKMYFEVGKGEIMLGFCDRDCGIFNYWGQVLFCTLLLESTARVLER